MIELLKVEEDVLEAILQKFVPNDENYVKVTYVIALSEHENKTTKYIIGHKYSTCHVGRFEKALLEVVAVIKLLQVPGMSSVWFRSALPVHGDLYRLQDIFWNGESFVSGHVP